MSRHKVRMAITGRDASPEAVSLHDLAEVLASVERLVCASAGSAPASETPQEVAISLVGIEDGSTSLVLSVQDLHVDAVSRVSKAVATDAYEDLPEPALLELNRLSRSLESRGRKLEILPDRDQGICHALIEAEKVPAPAGLSIVEGTTTIYGRCLRVGGATTPKAEIRLSSTGKILNVELSEEAAKELARRLYEEVILEGTVAWNAVTWEIESFRVSHIAPYRQTEPALAFKELAEAAHGQWDGVDAADYVRVLRSDD